MPRRAAICNRRWECRTSRPSFARKIEDLLEIVDKKLQPDQFSGFAQTGLRYQSNASLGAGSQTVLTSGGTLNSNFVARPDWNWFGTVGVDYVHDFQTQTGETFEASAIAYDAQQFSLRQFDIGLLEIRAGPRFAISPGDINGLTVKPISSRPVQPWRTLLTWAALAAD
jgi:hypothetical protein